MNLAVVIGVDKYEDHKISDLSACKNDAYYINKVLERSNKYEEILYFDDGNLSSTAIKSKLNEFIEKYKTEEIQEVFFYFSGHGTFDGEEFYYVCSDFNFLKKRTTSLENTELDRLLKSLNPKLAIKVVDACNSGFNYIKSVNSDALYKKIDSSKETYNNCYFLFSSQSNQVSLADKDISFFTYSFLRCVLETEGEKIRYKTLIDYISDDFEAKDQQTPYFVTQGTFREVFIEKNEPLIKELQVVSVNEKVSPGSPSLSLKDLIEEEAKKFLTLEEFDSVIEKIKNETLQKFKLNDSIKELFKISLEISPSTHIEDNEFETFVGKVLLKEKNNYFAVPTYSEISREVERKTYNSWDIMKTMPIIRTVMKKENVLDGYELTDSNIDYNFFYIKVTSNYPNLKDYILRIDFVYSRTEIKFFNFIGEYYISGWDTKKLLTKSMGENEPCLLSETESIEEILLNTFSSFNQMIEDDIISKYNISLEDQSI